MSEQKYLVFNVICRKCNYSFHSISDNDDYNSRLLLSERKLLPAKVMCDDDPAFAEVYELIKEQLDLKNKSAIEISRFFDAIFGKICEVASDGSKYSMTGMRHCIKCGSVDIEFGPTNPPIFKSEVLDEVSHKVWDCMSKGEKVKLIKKLILHSKGKGERGQGRGRGRGQGRGQGKGTGKGKGTGE